MNNKFPNDGKFITFSIMRNNTLNLLSNLINKERLVKLFRKILFPNGVKCIYCSSKQIHRLHSKKLFPRKYRCTKCDKSFTEWTGTVLSDAKLPVETTFLLLVLIAFGLPGFCIAYCLNISYKTAYHWYWRVMYNLHELDDKPVLSGIVEVDEVYATAGSKGDKCETRPPRDRGLKLRGRGTMAKDRPPILGLVCRTTKQIRLFVCEHLKTYLIEPLITKSVVIGSEIHSDGYEIYNGLPALGFDHKVVIHSSGLYAEDQDGDGICEVHCNSVEGLWSMLRHFLRGFRGVNKRNLSYYVRLFEYFYNARVENRSAEHILKEMIVVKDMRPMNI